MSELFSSIIDSFTKNANSNQKKGMEDYMRGQFQYFGIKSPQRAELSRPFFTQAKQLEKKELLDLIKQLWLRPERELHYFAQELFFKSKKHINEVEDIAFLEWMILRNSWWDTIDFIAPKLVKIYLDKFPDQRNEIVDKWVDSGNIWLQRSSILIHLKQKENLDAPYFFETILRLNNTGEFFIDKAIGWALRENAKKQAEIIYEWMDENQSKISKLSLKEGAKHRK